MKERVTFKTLVATTVLGAKLANSVRTQASLERREMNEVDENGWAHIHQATRKGYFKSVEKFIKANSEQLEFQTQDALRETPLMIAVRAGYANRETINVIVDLGGDLTAINTLNHGLVEICCLEKHIEVLRYLISLARPELPVWEKLLKFCTSELEEEAESAGQALYTLTCSEGGEVISPHWKNVYDCRGVKTLVDVIRSTVGDSAKVQMLKALINLLVEDCVKEQVVKCGGLEALIAHLKSSTNDVVMYSSRALSLVCVMPQFAEQLCQRGGMNGLVNVLKQNPDATVLVEAVNAVGIVCDGSKSRQTLFNSIPGAMQSISSILEIHVTFDLLLNVCHCVSKICSLNTDNQNSFSNSGGALPIIYLINMKNKDIQLAAVDTIHVLVDGNPDTQRSFMEKDTVKPLICLLNKSKSQEVQEKAASSLWSLAGENGDDKRRMAATIGVDLLIGFLSSLSETLHFIASEGLGVLAQGAHNEQDSIAEANGIHPLVRLLKSNQEYIVLSAVRSIRHFCVGVGYLPHPSNQKTVAQARGIKLLLALLSLSQSELIQVEAALTLSYVALGNLALMKEILTSGQHLEFSYTRLLQLLYSRDKVVRLLASATLATFAYNNISQQQLIASEGGVRFSRFVEFLQSDEEYIRCNAAFQVVVLARIIPDEEQAVTSAAGIKLLVDILQESDSEVIQTLAADCIARLAHTRAGIPQAFVAIDSVKHLCSLLYSRNTQVRGCAAIALSCLSYNHMAERQLLNMCRADPYLMKCLLFYTEKHRLSDNFQNEWNHYKRVGCLPPISSARPNLVSRQGYIPAGVMPSRKAAYTTSSVELPLISPSADPQPHSPRGASALSVRSPALNTGGESIDESASQQTVLIQ